MYKIGDQVRVVPEHRNTFSEYLFDWINDREGTIEEIQHFLKGNTLFLIRFKDRCPNHDGTPRTFGGNAWHCHLGDLHEVHRSIKDI